MSLQGGLQTLASLFTNYFPDRRSVICSFRIFALLLVMCPVVCSQAVPRIGQAAPDFILTDAKGSPVRLSALKGKVVLLDFWATWCTGCKDEIPWYMEFEDKYRNKGFAAIGVSMDDDGWKSVRPFLKEHKINYAVVIGTSKVANEYGGVPSLPMTLLIDRRGKIADWHAGVVNKNNSENRIKQLLRQSGM